MRFFRTILILLAATLIFACGSREQKPSTPRETLFTYLQAVKRKDTTKMKLLLSDASIKMAEQQAKEQNVALDDVIKNEPLLTENQKVVEVRNEKIEGERATIEIKISKDTWDTLPFVLEGGVWKIDKQGVANQLLQESEMDKIRLEEIRNQGRQP